MVITKSVQQQQHKRTVVEDNLKGSRRLKRITDELGLAITVAHTTTLHNMLWLGQWMC